MCQLARAYDELDRSDEKAADSVVANAVIAARVRLWRALLADGWTAPAHIEGQLARDAALSREPVPTHAEPGEPPTADPASHS